MIGDHLRGVPSSGRSVDDVETAVPTVVLQTAERVAQPRTRRLPRRGWKGDAQAEAEVKMVKNTRRTTWKRHKADTQNNQLKRAVQRENTRVCRVGDDAYERLLGSHVQGIQEDLSQRDQKGFYQRLTSQDIEDTRSVSSGYIRDEEGKMLRDPEFVFGRLAWFFDTFFKANSNKLRLYIIEGPLQGHVTNTLLGVEAT